MLQSLSKRLIILFFSLPVMACTLDAPTSPNNEAEEFVTQADEASAVRVADPQPTLDALFLRVAERLPGFAGAYFASDGHLHVLSAASQLPTRAEARAALGAVFGAEFLNAQELKGDDLIKVQPAERSFPILYEIFRSIQNEVFHISGVNSLDIDEVRNQIVIGVDSEIVIPTVFNRISLLQIDDRSSFNIEVKPRFRALQSVSLRDHRRPLIGGIQIDDNDGEDDFCNIRL